MTCPVVYEFWSGDQPLYVGVTNNFQRRMGEHRGYGYCLRGATSIRLSFFDDRARAEAYEEQRIRELRPRNNIRGNPAHQDPVMYGEDSEWAAYWHDSQQESFDILFCATELGPTPTYSARERRTAALELLRATRLRAA